VASDPSTDLLRAAVHGDDGALAEFVRRTQDRVVRLCAHLGSPRDADDLAQESFLRAVAALPRFRGESSAETWLVSIVRHVCADHVRKRIRRAAIDERFADRGEGSVLADHRADLDDVLSRLDPDQRAAFVLTQELGLSYEEAAEVCDCPVGTIRSRVARARAQLLADLTDRAGRRMEAG
jgi:RNA polymerase sigma-70 factor (ECF subfamily)